jgi:predicted esterase
MIKHRLIDCSYKENLLILFHGFGDNMDNFARFATAMELPQTCIMALEAPHFIPGVPSWFPIYDLSGNDLDISSNEALAGLEKNRNAFVAFLASILKSPTNPNGWSLDRIFFLGFAQGATFALDVLAKGRVGNQPLRIKGCICICGWLFPTMYSEIPKIYGDIIVTYGAETTNDTVLKDYLARVASENIEFHHISDKNLSMPRCKVLLFYTRWK